MNKEQAIKFLQEQVDGIETAIKEGKIFNSVENLRERQKTFKDIIKLLNGK